MPLLEPWSPVSAWILHVFSLSLSFSKSILLLSFPSSSSSFIFFFFGSLSCFDVIFFGEKRIKQWPRSKSQTTRRQTKDREEEGLILLQPLTCLTMTLDSAWDVLVFLSPSILAQEVFEAGCSSCGIHDNILWWLRGRDACGCCCRQWFSCLSKLHDST